MPYVLRCHVDTWIYRYIGHQHRKNCLYKRNSGTLTADYYLDLELFGIKNLWCPLRFWNLEFRNPHSFSVEDWICLSTQNYTICVVFMGDDWYPGPTEMQSQRNLELW